MHQKPLPLFCKEEGTRSNRPCLMPPNPTFSPGRGESSMDSAGSGLVNWPLSGRLCRLGTKQSTLAPKSNKPGGGGSRDCCCKGGLGRPRLKGCQHREMGVGEPTLLPTPDLCALGLAHNPHRTLGNFRPLPLALGTLVTRAEAASVSVSSWVCLCKSCVLVCIGLYICVPLWVHAFVFLSLTASFKDMISASFQIAFGELAMRSWRRSWVTCRDK